HPGTTFESCLSLRGEQREARGPSSRVLNDPVVVAIDESDLREQLPRARDVVTGLRDLVRIPCLVRRRDRPEYRRRGPKEDRIRKQLTINGGGNRRTQFVALNPRASRIAIEGAGAQIKPETVGICGDSQIQQLQRALTGSLFQRRVILWPHFRGFGV